MASRMMDDSTSSRDRKQLMDHLAHCDQCHATWEQLEMVDRLFKQGLAVTPSRNFARRMEESLASLPPRRAQGMLSPLHKLVLLVAPCVIFCTCLFMVASTLVQQPILLVRPLFVGLPWLVSVGQRILNSEIMQQWSLALRVLQDQWQVQLQDLTQMTALHMVLVGYLATSVLLGMAGFYLLHRINLQATVLASRTS